VPSRWLDSVFVLNFVASFFPRLTGSLRKATLLSKVSPWQRVSFVAADAAPVPSESSICPVYLRNHQRKAAIFGCFPVQRIHCWTFRLSVELVLFWQSKHEFSFDDVYRTNCGRGGGSAM
jgi:hypothetical protein